MNEYFKLDLPNAELLWVVQNALNGRSVVLAGNQNDQVRSGRRRRFLLGRGFHPSTPAAKRSPRFSPFHSLSRGWSGPETTSVEPSSAFAKHNRSLSLAMLRITGECDAI